MKTALRLAVPAFFILVIIYANYLTSEAAPPTPAQESFLTTVAQKTWTYLKTAANNHLPYSWSWANAVPSGGAYANPTEIGLYMLSYIGANEMGLSGATQALTESEVGATLNQLRAWQIEVGSPNAYLNSVFYRAYHILPNPPIVGPGSYDHEVSSIDNAFLAASLMTIREWAKAKGLTGLEGTAKAILDDMDFNLWYTPPTHRFKHGSSGDPLGGADWDYYSNEGRLINFVARALGQMTSAEFQLSLQSPALVQIPGVYDHGTVSTADDITVQKVAWDGSYFTYLAPALFIREMESDYASQTINPATEAQMAYATEEAYAAWGISDVYGISPTPDYVTSGAPPLSPANLAPPEPPGYEGLIAPHASALGLLSGHASEAAGNLQKLATFSQLYDPVYGFKDSVMGNPANSSYGKASRVFSALGQAYVFLAIAEHKTAFIWRNFYRDMNVQLAHQEMLHDLNGCSLSSTKPLTSAADNLDRTADDWGVFCDLGSPTRIPKWVMEQVIPPTAMPGPIPPAIPTDVPDGEALRCSLAGGDPYGKIHCYRNLISEPNASMFTLDTWFYFDPTTCNNLTGISTIQAIEFSASKFYQGQRYEFAVQWQNVYDGTPPAPTTATWHFWNGSAWVDVNPVFEQCLEGGVWHRLRLDGAIVNEQVQYRNFVVDGVEHLLTDTVASTPSSLPNQLSAAFQLDANSSATPYSVYFDHVRFRRWTGLLLPQSPAQGATLNTLQPSLSWSALPGAVRYQLGLGLTDPTTTIIYDGTALNYTPTCGPLTENTWYWRVRGIDSSGYPSPWTQPQILHLNAPTNAAPPRNIYTTSTPILTWNRVDNATQYQIKLNEDGITTVPSSQLEFMPTLGEGLYCWQVRANVGGSWRAWSAADSFIVDVP